MRIFSLILKHLLLLAPCAHALRVSLVMQICANSVPTIAEVVVLLTLALNVTLDILKLMELVKLQNTIKNQPR